MSEKYTVYLSGHAETSVTVEADDPDEAIDKACNAVHPFICHQCAREIDLGDEWEPNAVFTEGGDIVWPTNE
ncbi:hypothetical protein PJP13_24305 [Mycobacterium kansasii]